MKKLVLIAATLCVAWGQRVYTAPELKSPVKDKNFYLLSRLERDPRARAALERSPVFAKLATERTAALEQAVKTCGLEIACYTAALKWTDEKIAEVQAALRQLHEDSAEMRAFRSSIESTGMYVRLESKDPAEFLGRAWADCARGMNNMIAVYATGAAPRYPAIDSMTYDAKSEIWRRLVQGAAAVLLEDQDNAKLFFQPSLRFALEMMEFNLRDEAGRFEPMERGENAAAVRHAKTIDWSKYAYSAIVVPGAGNDRPGVRLSPAGKLRDEIATKRFRDGKAPFIIVSGGFVHPNRTEYAEAIEMKRDLMTRLGVPESAIIVDPHARHTTTNMRNATRLIYRYGMPFNKKALVSTDFGQSAYIEAPGFEKRCLTELGYMPYRLLGRTSQFDLEFLPLIESLMADPRDPLDP